MKEYVAFCLVGLGVLLCLIALVMLVICRRHMRRSQEVRAKVVENVRKSAPCMTRQKTGWCSKPGLAPGPWLWPCWCWGCCWCWAAACCCCAPCCGSAGKEYI